MITAISQCTAKSCRICKQHKPLEKFYKKKNSIDGHESSCICCRRNQMSKTYKQRYHSANRRNQHLMRTYLIDQSIYDHLLLMQGGRCALCSAESSGRKNDNYFVVDHCHITGDVRGLLCHHCNIMLGSSKDNINTLQNAITYLSQHTRNPRSTTQATCSRTRGDISLIPTLTI